MRTHLPMLVLCVDRREDSPLRLRRDAAASRQSPDVKLRSISQCLRADGGPQSGRTTAKGNSFHNDISALVWRGCLSVRLCRTRYSVCLALGGEQVVSSTR